MVIQNTRQLRMQKTEMSFTKRSAVLSRASSARQSDLDGRRVDPTLTVANFDMVTPGHLRIVHLIGDRMVSMPRQPVDAASDQKMRAQLLGRAEELVNIALAIANMDKPRRLAEQRYRLAHVFQPADALLVLDRHSRRIDLLLEGGSPLELLPRPEFDGRKAQGQSLGRDRQVRVHQKPADRVHSVAAGLVFAAVDPVGETESAPGAPADMKTLSCPAEPGLARPSPQSGPGSIGNDLPGSQPR